MNNRQEYFSYIQYLAISMTCKRYYQLFKPNPVLFVKQKFNEIGIDYIDLKETKCALSGGFLVQIVYNLTWASDIDLFTEFDGGVLYKPYDPEYDCEEEPHQGLITTEGKPYFTTRPFGASNDLDYSLVSRQLYYSEQIKTVENHIYQLDGEKHNQKMVLVNKTEENDDISQNDPSPTNPYEQIKSVIHQIKDFTLHSRLNQAVPVQDIILKPGLSIQEAIDNFDINLCQVYFDGTRIRFKNLNDFFTIDLKYTVRSRTKRRTMIRLRKYLTRFQKPDYPMPENYKNLRPIDQQYVCQSWSLFFD